MCWCVCGSERVLSHERMFIREKQPGHKKSLLATEEMGSFVKLVSVALLLLSGAGLLRSQSCDPNKPRIECCELEHCN